MGTSVAIEPLNSFIIYDLLIVFSAHFQTSRLEMVALATSRRIFLTIYLIDITHIEKQYVIKLAKN